MSQQDGQPSSQDMRADACVRYKYQRLRDRLRQAIVSGELGGKLPGERELARRYDANAKTINKALCDLTTEGLLVRHVGRGTFVSDGASPTGTSRRKLLTFAWVSSSSANSDHDASIRSATEALIRERGHRMISVSAGGPAKGTIADAVLTPGQLRSWDGIVLAGRASDRLIADLHRRHLPTVQVLNTHDRIRTNAVLPDYSQGAFELAQYLFHLGHERIALMISSRLVPAACAADIGYRAALQRNGIEPMNYLVVGGDSEVQGKDGAAATAAICIGEDALQHAISESSSQTALSICALPEPGEKVGDTVVTSYDVSARDVAHWVVELLSGATPGQAPRTIIVPGQFVDRGSARPRAGAPTSARRPSHADV